MLNILSVIRLSISIASPSHFCPFIFMYLTKSCSLYTLHHSKLYLLPQCPLSCTAPKILLRIFLSNRPSALSSAFVSIQVSEALALQVSYTMSSFCPWNKLWLEMLPKPVKAERILFLSQHLYQFRCGNNTSRLYDLI
jgi:hypothetical protein